MFTYYKLGPHVLELEPWPSGRPAGKSSGSMRGHGEGSYRSLWSRLSRSYSYDIAPKSPMCQIKNEAMAMITPTADAATAPFFLSFSPTNRVAVK